MPKWLGRLVATGGKSAPVGRVAKPYAGDTGGRQGCQLPLPLPLQERELRTAHAKELDAVATRLSGVLARKDATIAALRTELDVTLRRLLAEREAVLADDEGL